MSLHPAPPSAWGRRAFLRAGGAAALAGCAPPWAGRSGGAARVDEVEVLTVRVDARRAFSTGAWTSRRHAVVRVGSGRASGWGEVRVPQDAEGWAAPLADLAGLDVDGARPAVGAWLRAGRWSRRHAEAAEMALLDLEGRLLGVPAVARLGLDGRGPVPALHAVLDDDPASVRAKVEAARARGLGSHVKLKLFAEPDLDAAVVGAARAAAPDAYLLGDLNRGYRRDAAAPPVPLPEIARRLGALRDAGLGGCEDPAALEPAEWVALQGRVGALDLVPDHPLRPARAGLDVLRAGMGRVVNLHPGTVGLLADAVALGRRAQALGLGVMVGDDSLVGPGCTAWQQVAVGLGAVWVEALEKPDEAPDVLRALVRTATSLGPDGRVALDPGAGWGADVDADALRALAEDRAAFAA